MEDRKLLELAAKAAGYKIKFGEIYVIGDDRVDCTDMPYVVSGQPDEADWHWNPLWDGGDALQLACHLCMSVSTGPIEATANTIAGALRGNFFKESTIGDQNAAVRRVIVRAAAEVGEQMP
jgi:hypothetical protein